MCVYIYTHTRARTHTHTRTRTHVHTNDTGILRDVGKILQVNGLLAFVIAFFAPCCLHLRARRACVRRSVCVCVCVCVCVRARARACVRACVTPRYTFMLHHVICLQTHAYRHTRTQCMFPWRELTHDDWLLPQLRGIQGAPHAVPLLSCIGAMVCRHRARLVHGPVCLHRLAGLPTSACACVHACMRPYEYMCRAYVHA